MLDIRLLRETPEVVRADQEKRDRPTDIVDKVRAADETWREAVGRGDQLRSKRNQVAKEIAELKKKGEDAAGPIAETKKLAAQIASNEEEVSQLAAARDELLRTIPNLMHESVPVGPDESGNVEVRTWGKAEKHPFEGVSHVDLLESLDVADIDRAARVAGARFFYLKNELVLLNQALISWALQRLSAKEFIPIEPPFMLRRDAIEGAVDLSDFEDVIYKVEDEDLYLIATSEHPMAAFHMGEIIEERDLPLRYVGTSPCFRKEAGAHGKDTKGIFRVHQFQKVEQFVYCLPEESWELHEELIANAEELYQELRIPYRVVNICTGDLGSIAAKKYDLEAWMPVQGAYREVVSCSNCTDYQARRYKTRTWEAPGKPTRFLHTLNSTAIATQRTLVAILENYQREDGSVEVPECLRPFAGGLEEIRPRDE